MRVIVGEERQIAGSSFDALPRELDYEARALVIAITTTWCQRAAGLDESRSSRHGREGEMSSRATLLPVVPAEAWTRNHRTVLASAKVKERSRVMGPGVRRNDRTGN
jgi:hypothetical protein